ncbi:dihydroceramide delta(4)-desaturase [Lactarius indigo]|nr:dihydroceramide delta(4)-desaturase [Lactarius indigo]
MTEEPHRSRRMTILKAHPEVTKLMGHEPLTKYVVLAVVLFQFTIRITHNLAFKGVKPNKVLAIIANLPIGVPYAISFKGYHLEHHKYLGEDGIDSHFRSYFTALRPGFVRSQRPTYWHFIGIAVQFFWAGSLHPLAGHFIAEHYVWDNLQQETYSYYGWLNILAYNVGYHNEHHDFPSVPWTRLPALRALAPEFYDVLPSHPSWPMVVINFIRDRNVGIFARAKRPPRAVKTAPPPVELDGGCADEGTQEMDNIRRRK